MAENVLIVEVKVEFNMNPEYHNEPAFPIEEVSGSGDHIQRYYTYGLSMLDYYAAKAMPHFIANPPEDNDIPKASYEIAHRMLIERHKINENIRRTGSPFPRPI